ncbi:hypothetical protein [Streptomyces sp. NPDC056817]|uniref:hypothetical protein n=1 Tax=Streptomyces sp. NPDC056817 TaxID=3345950 RepID=UPI0036B94D36
MEFQLAIPVSAIPVLGALVFAASGVAAVTRGWVPSGYRDSVRRVGLNGWGQLLVAVGLGCQVVLSHVMSWPGIWQALVCGPLLLAGIALMMVSRRAGGDRQGSDVS